MTLTLTPEQERLVREVCGWLLDQDHDDVSGEYLWFLTPSVGFDPVDADEIDQVRETLRQIVDSHA